MSTSSSPRHASHAAPTSLVLAPLFLLFPAHFPLVQDSFQSPLLVMVESGADQVVGRSWDVRLDPELTEDAGRYRKYDFSSVRDLLRVVRNKRHHFHELPERVQGLMSPLPSGFLRRDRHRLSFPFLVSSFRVFCCCVVCACECLVFFFRVVSSWGCRFCVCSDWFPVGH